jgi:hypothetical protein
MRAKAPPRPPVPAAWCWTQAPLARRPERRGRPTSDIRKTSTFPALSAANTGTLNVEIALSLGQRSPNRKSRGRLERLDVFLLARI